MADPISAMITNKKVKDTVESAKSMQDAALAKVQEMASAVGGITGGMSSVLSNAQNVLSNSISGIASSIADSVKAFSEKVNTGLTTTLTDMTKKAGSMISEVSGKTNLGAVSEKLSYVVNNVNASIDSTTLFGKSGNVNDLVMSFSSSQIDKMVSATGLSKITNNSDLTNAVSSISSSLSSMTAAAKSVVGTVTAMPALAVGAVVSTANTATSSLISQVTESVSNLAKTTGIGDVTTLIKDTYDLYSTGRQVYDVVSGKDPTTLVNIASNVNNSFPQIQNILNAATTICKTLNGKSIQNYSANKDLMDLLLYRMSNSGMYGAIQSLMNCTETQQYVDESTYFTLANRLSTVVNNGDVHTASTIQSIVGNSRISNPTTTMYNLGMNIQDTNASARSTYTTLLGSMNVSAQDLFSTSRTSSNGSNMRIYNARNINNFSNSSPNLFRDIMGDSKLATIASAVVSIL